MEKLAAREYTPEDLKKMAVLQTEIEEVYNFERDVATAKVQDPTFDAAVSRINENILNVRKTYKDPEYLRDPAKTKEEMWARHDADNARVNFEATKEALDLQRTKYLIKQSEAVAKDSENFTSKATI